MAKGHKRSASTDVDDTASSSRRSAPRPSRLGARSCEACYQRKVRCDRGVPCTNCSRHGVSCVYPLRDPDTARKPPSLQDIFDCLKRLELLLSRFAESNEVTTRPTGDSGRRALDIPIPVRLPAYTNAVGTAGPHSSDTTPNKSTWEILLNNSDIEPLLENESIGVETAHSHHRVDTTAQNRPPMQPDSCSHLDKDPEILDLYPDSQLALQLWDIYVKWVDPVLKVLHIPTVQSAVVATVLNPNAATTSTLALTFAIYYAAATAICHDYSGKPGDLPCERSVLLKRYQTALDRILLTPDVISRPEVVDLQALTIYVTCLRAHESGRRVWVLTGLVIRLAQSIGMHRDGTSLKLSPFETEMRLRLWWHLCVLDSRAPEDQGFKPTIDLANQELRLPLNVNDNRLYPDMTHFPVPSDGWTEISFFLIQTESCRVLHPILDTPQGHSADTLAGIREQRKRLQDPAQYLSAKYGISPSFESITGLPRISTQHVLTACKKMEFVLQLREEICLGKQNEGQTEATPDIHKLSFKLACDALESSHVLLKEGLAGRFQWFFNMYTQWYALAYVLRCLRSNPCGIEADRAWTLVIALFPRGENHQDHLVGGQDEHGHSRIWRFLKLLQDQASSLRKDARLPASQLFPPGEVLQPTNTTVEDHGTFILPEWGTEFVTESDQTVSSALNLLMPEIPFLPDWNAIVNGE